MIVRKGEEEEEEEKVEEEEDHAKRKEGEGNGREEKERVKWVKNSSLSPRNNEHEDEEGKVRQVIYVYGT